MKRLKTHADKLIAVLSSDYLEKLFYFCLKKTGNAAEAEDLASDIVVNIFAELHKGTIPVYFSAWVWKIARNRYSVWAGKRHQSLMSVSGTDIYDIEDVNDNLLEEEYSHGEELKLLRRELAFISKDYRNIIVAYYIEDRRVRDIALSLGLPEGTVKTKLFRSRKILKEGMNMAREFGVRSYKPEDIRFSASGNQPGGLPWSAVKRQIPKNILLQANNNPSTIEELSIELGIAMPYMEEEVKILTDATLMKKTENNKYITKFFIEDKECQMALYQTVRAFSKERSDIIDTIVTESFSDIKKLDIMRSDMSDDDFKWLLILHFTNYMAQKPEGYDITCPIKRNDGGDWGFIGYEQNDIKENVSMDYNGNGSKNLKIMFWTYDINEYGFQDRMEHIDFNQVLFLADIIKNKRNISSFTDSEEVIWWNNINKRFAHADEKGEVIPDIAVFEKDTQEEFYKILRQHRLYPALLEDYQKLFDDIVAILRKNSNPVLYEQLKYCASSIILSTRKMVVNDEIASGRLIVPKDPGKSTIAMYIEIK